MIGLDEIMREIGDAFFLDTNFSGDEISKRSDKFQDYEGNMVSDFFRGKKNSDISFNLMEREYRGDSSACLYFMNPDVAAYFVGSYMSMSLSEGVFGSAFRHSLINIFDSSFHHEAGAEEWFDRFLSALSDKQKMVIVKYLNYINKNYNDEFFCHNFDLLASNFLAKNETRGQL